MEYSNNLSLTSDAKYEAWRENLSALYDIFVKDRLTSTSLTVQWLPNPEKRRGPTSKRLGKLKLKQRLVLGSCNNDEGNHLKIASILFSEKKLKTHIDRMLSKPNPATCFIQIGTEITHSGIVNRARYMPQNPTILATKSSNGDVYIYDVRKIFSASKGNDTCDPDMKLKGLVAGGSGLSWNPNRRGYILSSSINERTIWLWDINSKSIKCGDDNSLNKFSRCHPLGVKDCSWHSLHSALFGSAGNDKNIHIWDIRADFTRMPAITGAWHKSSVNCLSFNCFSDHLFATGSSDETIAVWDLRKMKSPCHRLYWHKASISQLHWSPNNKSILASSGVDSRVLVWDISEIGAHQTPEEAKEAPPELLFIHGGHRDNVSDFSWNLTEPWLLSSVSKDNVIQVWQMGSHIYNKNADKKFSRLKSANSKESSKCLTIPRSFDSFSKIIEPSNVNDSLKAQQSNITTAGSLEVTDYLAIPRTSKSFSYPLSQAYLGSSSFESSIASGPIEPANITESLKSPNAQQSTMATCESGEATDYQAIPGSSKSFSYPVSQAYLGSSSFEYSTISGTVEPTNISEIQNSPKTQQSFISTCESGESAGNLAISGLTKTPDLTPDYLFSSPLNSPPPLIDEIDMLLKPLPRLSPLSESSFELILKADTSSELPELQTTNELPKPSVSRLSPLSKSSIDDSSESAASPNLPNFPTSMESPKSLASSSTPESIKSLEFSSSEPPTPPESAKVILLPYFKISERNPEFPKETEDGANQDAEGTSHSDLSKVSTLCSLPQCQSCSPTRYKYSPCFTHNSEKDPMMPSESKLHVCDGYSYSSVCPVCLILNNKSDPNKQCKKVDQSSSKDYQTPQVSFSTSHLSTHATSSLYYPTLSETQKQGNIFQSANTKIPDPSIYSDDPVLTDFKMYQDRVSTQDFQELPDNNSDAQDPPDNTLRSDEIGTQDSQMLSGAHVPTDILDPSDSISKTDIQSVKEITHNPKQQILSNFPEPSISSDNPVLPDFQMSRDRVSTQHFQELPDDNSDAQDPPDNTLQSDDTATQDSQMLSDAHVPADILVPADSIGIKDIKSAKDITHNPKQQILSNFQTLSVSPTTQLIKIPLDVTIYSEDTPNTQDSQGAAISTMNNPNEPNIIVFQNLTESPSYVNIQSSKDIPKNQEILTSSDVSVASKVTVYPDLKNPQNGFECADTLNPPDVPSIQDFSIPPGKPTS